MLWGNALYPVNHILLKCWLASNQARSRGGVMRRGEQDDGNRKAQFAIVTQIQQTQDVIVSPEKGTEPRGSVANLD